MLTVEQNEELTQIGPGTPMGELLRRYWYPIAFEQDFDSVPSKSVRLLSEDWTLYKTPSGKYGIIAEKCAHRSASLTYGVVHEDGIRCGYHGWKWDFDGTCVEQPAESGLGLGGLGGQRLVREVQHHGERQPADQRAHTCPPPVILAGVD